jgi:hypothetical protein
VKISATLAQATAASFWDTVSNLSAEGNFGQQGRSLDSPTAQQFAGVSPLQAITLRASSSRVVCKGDLRFERSAPGPLAREIWCGPAAPGVILDAACRAWGDPGKALHVLRVRHHRGVDVLSTATGL